jgi:hypothetical protein
LFFSQIQQFSAEDIFLLQNWSDKSNMKEDIIGLAEYQFVEIKY